jgi:hypothetical protein
LFDFGSIGLDAYNRKLFQIEKSMAGIAVHAGKAAKFGSAEALSRVQDFQQRVDPLSALERQRLGINYTAPAPGGGGQIGSAQAAQGIQKSNDLLQQLVNIAKAEKAKPELEDADLGGGGSW